MYVYVVTWTGVVWGGGGIEGVFSSRDLAEAAVERALKEGAQHHHPNDYDIEQVELDR